MWYNINRTAIYKHRNYFLWIKIHMSIECIFHDFKKTEEGSLARRLLCHVHIWTWYIAVTSSKSDSCEWNCLLNFVSAAAVVWKCVVKSNIIRNFVHTEVTRVVSSEISGGKFTEIDSKLSDNFRKVVNYLCQSAVSKSKIAKWCLK